MVQRPLHRPPEGLMSDTISPSVDSRVPHGSDAFGIMWPPKEQSRSQDTMPLDGILRWVLPSH